MTPVSRRNAAREPRSPLAASARGRQLREQRVVVDADDASGLGQRRRERRPKGRRANRRCVPSTEESRARIFGAHACLAAPRNADPPLCIRAAHPVRCGSARAPDRVRHTLCDRVLDLNAFTSSRSSVGRENELDRSGIPIADRACDTRQLRPSLFEMHRARVPASPR